MFLARKPRAEQPRGTLTPQQMATFSHAVAEYISVQRDRYYNQAAPLTFGNTWLRFFPAADLERLRVLQPGRERIPNPPFYADLERLGFTGLPDFTTMAAITFDDVVVFHDPITPQLVFHELVHVVQYRLLGIEEFARYTYEATCTVATTERPWKSAPTNSMDGSSWAVWGSTSKLRSRHGSRRGGIDIWPRCYQENRPFGRCKIAGRTSLSYAFGSPTITAHPSRIGISQWKAEV